jgi:hypothetical protein
MEASYSSALGKILLRKIIISIKFSIQMKVNQSKYTKTNFFLSL